MIKSLLLQRLAFSLMVINIDFKVGIVIPSVKLRNYYLIKNRGWISYSNIHYYLDTGIQHG